MSENIFYQAKKNFFKYVALPALAILSSCSLNKEFVQDDIYYSPKDDKPKTEIAYLDSISKKVPADTLEIETLQDLNYAVRNGADATNYWENYFIYSPYSSSLGWDWDGDGIVNAFDLHPWNYNFADDFNNNGISDDLEFSSYFYTDLDFLYWDLYWNNNWNYRYDYYWNYPWRHNWAHNHINIYYFDDEISPVRTQRRQRTLTERVSTQSISGTRRSDQLNPKVERQRTTNQVSTRQRYERPESTRERTNTNYMPQTNTRTRNTYSPRSNTRTRSTNTRNTQIRQSTPTRSSGTRVRSSSGSSRSSGSSTRSSGSSSGSSGSSNSSNRSGGRR